MSLGRALGSACSIRSIVPVSLPGLTGQSSIFGRWLRDRPVIASAMMGQDNGNAHAAASPSRLFFDQCAEPAFLLLWCRGLGCGGLRGRGNRLADFLEKLHSELLRSGVDQARTKLGKLAADLRLHLVVQVGGAGVLNETHDGAALGETGSATRPFAGDRVAIGRIEIG